MHFLMLDCAQCFSAGMRRRHRHFMWHKAKSLVPDGKPTHKEVRHLLLNESNNVDECREFSFLCIAETARKVMVTSVHYNEERSV
jgi:hypothetical protein